MGGPPSSRSSFPISRIDANALAAMGINEKTDVEKFLDAVARLKASGTIESAESIDPDQVLKDFIADMEATKKRQVTREERGNDSKDHNVDIGKRNRAGVP